MKVSLHFLVRHPGLTKKLSKDVECVQKRFLKLVSGPFIYWVIM